MNASDLIATYSVVGDLVTAVLCVAVIIIIWSSISFSDDKNFVYLKRSCFAILTASVANVLFAFVCENYPDNNMWIITLRSVYHVFLILSLLTFVLYLRNLLVIDETFYRKFTNLNYVVFSVGLALDVWSPFTHFGFYYQDGLWYDPTFLKPYTFVHIWAVLMLMGLIMFAGKNMIRTVRQTLIKLAIMVCAIMIIESVFNSNAFTTFTFILPIIVVLILLHSQPYDIETGVQSIKVFEDYIAHAYKRRYSVDYMVLRLDMRMVKTLPKELGQLLSSFWHYYFKKAVFFSVANGVFVLAVARYEKNGDTEKKIKELFYEQFPDYYRKFKLKYKILGMTDVDFIRSGQELSDIIEYVMSSMNTNQIKMLNSTEKAQISLMRNVKDELADICYKNDLNDHRVVVYCQPIRNISTGGFTTAESLMRLKSTNGELISPGIFIPMAEQFGYIHTLSMIMLNKVCKNIRKMLDEGCKFERVTVNFSSIEFKEDGFVEEVIGIIMRNNVPFDKLGIELTESQNESDYALIKDKITSFKDQGIKIYLDDFGTGYSNFDRILKFGFDVIKFDRSLLLLADTDESVMYTLQHFSKAFKELGYAVLFEGIETEMQEELCKKCNANYLQGFMYSKPIEMEKMSRVIAKAQ